jgi:NAD(P)-dependent dehydrogenase (short-subunit alcohol dehydrogenase family)
MAGNLDSRAAGARRLAGKVCIVTGAGQGIGRATARRLGEEGGRIVVADRIDDGATEAVSELRGSGVEATKALVDVSSFAGAQELMGAARAAYGRIDVLVNNVGGTIWIKPYHLYTEDGPARSSMSARNRPVASIVSPMPQARAVWWR